MSPGYPVVLCFFCRWFCGRSSVYSYIYSSLRGSSSLTPLLVGTLFDCFFSPTSSCLNINNPSTKKRDLKGSTSDVSFVDVEATLLGATMFAGQSIVSIHGRCSPIAPRMGRPKARVEIKNSSLKTTCDRNKY